MKRLLPAQGHRSRRLIRGTTMLEALISASIGIAVIGTATGVYVTGTRRFYGEQSQTYVQFRARTMLDQMASETRAARGFMGATTLNFSDGTSASFAASDGSDTPACLIIQVPAQDSGGLLYWGQGTANQNTLATDTIVYWHQPGDRTLHRAVAPARNVLCADGKYHNSWRGEEKNSVVARDMAQVAFVFRDNNGAVVTGQPSHIASVDLQAGMRQTSAVGGGTDQTTVSISGVRLRNQRSGSIYGMVSPVVQNVKVEAIMAVSTGAYPVGTVVGSGYTDANGYYEVFGLEEGKYSLKFTAPSGAVTNVAGPLAVPSETAYNNHTTTITQ